MNTVIALIWIFAPPLAPLIVAEDADPKPREAVVAPAEEVAKGDGSAAADEDIYAELDEQL